MSNSTCSNNYKMQPIHFYPINTHLSTLFEKSNTAKKWIDFISSCQQKIEEKYTTQINMSQLQAILYQVVQTVYHVDTTQLHIVPKQQSIKEDKHIIPLPLSSVKKTQAECKKMNMNQLKEHILQHLSEIQKEYVNVTTDGIKKMKRDQLVGLIQKHTQVKKSKSSDEPKASTKLAEVINQLDQPVSKKTSQLINFKTDKPVDISNDAFWKVKINTFLYIDEEEEEEVETRFEHHGLTGFLFYSTQDSNVVLFGRVIDGEVIKWDQLDEDTILWAQRCGIQVEEFLD